VFARINDWWRRNAAEHRASVVAAYSFGKAQHLLAGVDTSIGPIWVQRSVDAMNQACAAAGLKGPTTRLLESASSSGELAGALVIAPPQTLSGAARAFASGWTLLRSGRRRRGFDCGFALSDHADWPGLQRAIRATGAERVIVTHGQEAVMVRWLQEQGLRAQTFSTEYGDRDDDQADAPPAQT
jgi:putative mRNA 3-end processing factor